jgi:carbonic anhydrase
MLTAPKQNFINPSLFANLATKSIELNQEIIDSNPSAQSDESAKIIADLMRGNRQVVEQQAQNNHRNTVRLSGVAQGRKAIATIINYAHVPMAIEDLFGQKFGDLVVVNAPGQQPDRRDIGTLEYNAIMEGVRVAIILCEPRPQLTQRITYKIDRLKLAFEQRYSPLADDILANPHADVRARIDRMMSSRSISRLVANGSLHIVGAMYDPKTGLVSVV